MLIVLLAGLVPRLVLLVSLPILLTNDSLDYASTALQLISEGNVDIKPQRTPGYPLLLGGAFTVFGVTGTSVLFLHHVLGLGTAMLATIAAARFVRPAWAGVIGVLVACDFWFLGFAHVMLSETSATFFFVASVAAAVHMDRRPLLGAGAAGLTLACACLVRPVMQVALPFLALAAMLVPAPAWHRRTASLGVFVLAFALTASPWLVHNARRGIYGFGEGFAWALWVSLVQQDLFDREHPVPPEVEPAAKVLREARDGGQVVWSFLADPAVVAQPKSFYRDWALASIRKQPGRYVQRIGWAMLWQLNLYPARGPITWEQTREFLRWVTRGNAVQPEEPSNFFVTDWIPPELRSLGMPLRDGIVQRAFAAWVNMHPGGIPQVPLFVLALAGGVLSLRRRQWHMTGVLLATGAVLAIHAVMVCYQSRYSIPAWIAWYPLSAYVLGGFGRRRSAEPSGTTATATPPAPASV
jgi:hypothetical protein